MAKARVFLSPVSLEDSGEERASENRWTMQTAIAGLAPESFGDLQKARIGL
ncbi:MAG: hypothetical protein M3T96_10805 [Acidobacteriota bacterium]|nr:hypothetical protein [Acidobacteriota bacterium]